MMYYFCEKWYESYDSMLNFPDGELRNPHEKNDFSDETDESKIKYFLLFDSESPIVFSYLA